MKGGDGEVHCTLVTVGGNEKRRPSESGYCY